jgi:hypothetical protein
MDTIKNWLNGHRNFIIGRAIYRALISSDDALIKSLDAGYTAHRHQQLIKAMELHINPTISHPVNCQKMVTLEPIDDTNLDDQKNEPVAKIVVDPLVLKSIHNEWQIPYKKMQYCIGQLDQFGTSNKKAAITKRAELAKEILELEQVCMSIWAKRDQYEKTGVLINQSADELEIPTDPIELATLINKIKKAITNNRLRMQKNPDNPGYIERFQNAKMQYFKVTGKHYIDQQQTKPNE